MGVKAALCRNPDAAILTFDDETGAVIDLDLRGTEDDIRARLLASYPTGALRPEPEVQGAGNPARGRGRPRLGVVAREVTLLPRHWDWLATQRGGASQALRRMIDQARQADDGEGRARAAREAAYRFMAALGGDFPGFEEACRALFADDREGFATHTLSWPPDVRHFAQRLAWGNPDDSAARL